jgi:uncharacterized protein YndB with AHSA1/START domain
MSYTASAKIIIKTDPKTLWSAITNPYKMKLYFESDQAAEWKEGSPLIFQGNWKGEEYQDKGIILEIVEERIFTYSHWSPYSGRPDLPKYYEKIRFEITPFGDTVELSVTQSKFDTQLEAEKISQSWTGTLQSIKEMLEK